jgi:hypothetical protein
MASPNFLHFVGLDRGRHPGLPWGVAAGVTRRSTKTESPSQSSNTFGDSKLARQPEMCRGQSNTTGVLSSFCCPRVLSMRIYILHVTCNNMGKLSDWSVLGLLGKSGMRRFQRYLQQGKRTSGRCSKPVSRQKMCQNGHNPVRKAYGNPGGK